MPQRTASVAAAIAKVPHLAMLPGLAARITTLADDADTSVQQMTDVISRSPELSTRVLKVVNSALYGVPGEISSISRAISMLGLVAVKNVAIAASLTRVFEGPRFSLTFSMRDLWTHSLAVGTATRMVAQSMRSALLDDAFLGGLLHDVGLMVEWQFNRRAFAAMVRRLESESDVDVLAVEVDSFRADHQDFGAGLLDRWKLPRPLCAVAGWHHRPLLAATADRILVTMVHVADRLVVSCPPSFPVDVRVLAISDDVLDQLKVTRQQLEGIQARLPPALEESRSLLAG